jgi:hypothetical protein
VHFFNFPKEMVKAAELFPGPHADGSVKGVKQWLNSKGVRDFEPVSLFCDQLGKVGCFPVIYE